AAGRADLLAARRLAVAADRRITPARRQARWYRASCAGTCTGARGRSAAYRVAGTRRWRADDRHAGTTAALDRAQRGPRRSPVADRRRRIAARGSPLRRLSRGIASSAVERDIAA